MLERGFRLRVLEGLCDVGLVVELGLGLGNRRGGEREPDGEEGGLEVLEGLCDVGLVVELGLGLGNRRGGEREPDGEEGGFGYAQIGEETKRSSSAMGFVKI
uniref:Uncharacterized protein n=1 Tax=Fagus sylvatica TaxID=28930 RepID=A0A2N9G3N2_FAGSY